MSTATVQPAGALSSNPIALKSPAGAVKVMVTLKVAPGSCATLGRSLRQFAGPTGGGVGVGDGVGLAVGVGVGGSVGVGVGGSVGVGVGDSVGVGVGGSVGVGVGVSVGVGVIVGVGVGAAPPIYRSTAVAPRFTNKMGA